MKDTGMSFCKQIKIRCTNNLELCCYENKAPAFKLKNYKDTERKTFLIL